MAGIAPRMCDAHRDEPGFAKQSPEVLGIEAKPDIALFGAHPFLFVVGKIEHPHHRPWLEKPVDFPQEGLWLGCVVQGVAHQHAIEGSSGQTRVREVGVDAGDANASRKTARFSPSGQRRTITANTMRAKARE